MVDGTRLNLGTDGDMAATDDIADAGVANGHKVQRVKAGWGTDGGYKDPNHTTPLPVDSYEETNGLSAGGVLLTPKFVEISTSATSTTIVSGVADRKIRVLSYVLSASNAVNAKWQSGTTPDKTGLLYISQNGGFVSGYCPVGHFETNLSSALTLNLSGAVAVGGHVTYVEVP